MWDRYASPQIKVILIEEFILNLTTLINTAKNELSDLSEQAGTLLYSSAASVQKGDVYFLGFNPGGINGVSFKDNLALLPSKTSNSYLDEEWENDAGSWAAGESPLQKRVQWLFESLNLQTKDICASNLIFFQSKQASEINYNLADRCWPVHEQILRIVQPKVILTFGNSGTSPYSYLYQKFGSNTKQEMINSGHGDWSLKAFSTTINNIDTIIIGLPHLSRYSPIGKNFVIEWIRNRVY